MATQHASRSADRPPDCPVCAAPPGPPVLSAEDRIVAQSPRFFVSQCSRCGLAYTHPRDVDFAAHYPATSYHAYQAGRDSRFNRLHLWLITRVPYGPIARRSPGRLLDVGCGAGELARAFRRQGWQVSGVEPSAAGATVAAERGIEMHCGTLEEAPWVDGTFDAVILNHALEHMPDPRLALDRVHALLKDDGMLGISVPNFGSWQRRVFGAAWFQLDLPRHLQHFDEASLEYLVRGSGFDLVRIRSMSMMAGLLPSLQFKLFGRSLLAGRPARLTALALYPALAASDLLAPGDCLTLVARKPAPPARASADGALRGAVGP